MNIPEDLKWNWEGVGHKFRAAFTREAVENV